MGLSARAEVAASAVYQEQPIANYLEADKATEIALARSAAPSSVSNDAEIMVLEPGGYISEVAGTNGFVCLVERSWNSYLEDPEFWNPKIKVPACYDRAAAKSVLQGYLKRSSWVVKGANLTELRHDISDEIATGAYISPETGSICLMMSKTSYFSDKVGHAHPHMMFFYPRTADVWNPDLTGTPVGAVRVDPEPIEILYVDAAHWSDGSAAGPMPMNGM